MPAPTIYRDERSASGAAPVAGGSGVQVAEGRHFPLITRNVVNNMMAADYVPYAYGVGLDLHMRYHSAYIAPLQRESPRIRNFRFTNPGASIEMVGDEALATPGGLDYGANEAPIYAPAVGEIVRRR